MGFLIDTSVLVAWERRVADVPAKLAALGDERIALSAVTAMELLHGVERADDAHRDARRAFVEYVLSGWPVFAFDLDVSRIAARIWADMAKRGVSPGATDLLIGATALRHGFGIVTRNPRHFDRIPGLRVDIW